MTNPNEKQVLTGAQILSICREYIIKDGPGAIGFARAVERATIERILPAATDPAVNQRLTTATPTLYQHTDGRYGLSLTGQTPAFTAGDPAWYRVPVDVVEGGSEGGARPVDYISPAKIRGKLDGAMWRFDDIGLSLYAYDIACAARPAAKLDAPAPAAEPINHWLRAEQLADLPAVDEALRVFCEDASGDNGIGVIVAVLEAIAAPPAPVEAEGVPMQRLFWLLSHANVIALANEISIGATTMGSPDDEGETPDLILEVRPAGTVADDDGKLNAGPILAISLAEYPDEGVYPIDPTDPTGGRQDAAPPIQPSPVARDGGVPVEPSALEASIRDLDAWEVRSDGNELTPAESEAIMLVLHELKRLRAALAPTKPEGGNHGE